MWRFVFVLLLLGGCGAHGARWEIIIHTSDKEGAGTDSDIYITLHGSRGSSAEISLGNADKNYFERNQIDRFFVTTDDIGDVCSLTIRSADFGSGKNNAEVLVRLLVIREN
ncbi:lipoxygenase homology domain-containing protein 1-like isoform X2 [Pomacea canaliculata]|uniref:lipoxygenase homology domain-containing protein 1-like isoform X2 n=1 Tax=Pomacea canaliculata TaxID=400727 RepID=UPI000D736B4C|nr:lipoxygenase homology domain-containing protein 1-like isoform X2 [Pomacea canaliculata]